MTIDGKMTDKQALTAWKLLYSLMDNVKTKMDSDYKNHNGLITEDMYFDNIKYIVHSVNNILNQL